MRYDPLVTEAETPAAPAAKLSSPDLQSLKHAAALWIVAQLLLFLGTATFLLLSPRRDELWRWELIYSGGPQFTTFAGRAPLILPLLCSAGWILLAPRLHRQ